MLRSWHIICLWCEDEVIESEEKDNQGEEDEGPGRGEVELVQFVCHVALWH